MRSYNSRTCIKRSPSGKGYGTGLIQVGQNTRQTPLKRHFHDITFDNLVYSLCIKALTESLC